MIPQFNTKRRRFLKQSAVTATALVCWSANQPHLAKSKEVDRTISIKSPPGIRQKDVLFENGSYTAFPHVIRLDGDELLMAFRQAPSQEQVRHTHPRSVITIIRSYDLGETWDIENATQMAAGGGQEFAPIHLGKGIVGGLLAAHEVVPVREGRRAKIFHLHQHEYPFTNVGGFWCWSNNFGLTWPLHHNVLFAPRLHPCASAVRLSSGTLLAPCYGNIDQGVTGISSNFVYRSDDGGKSWSAPTLLAEGTEATRDFYEPCLLELAEGHLLAMHRVGRCQDGRHGLFWQNESRDGGRSWTGPVETKITSGACPRLLKLSDGRILLTFGRRYEPYGLYAKMSCDGARSWEDTSWLLRAAPNGDQGYSSSIEIEPGRVLTACYAQNEQGVTGITGTFWTVPPADR